jgi:hypothetical protein
MNVKNYADKQGVTASYVYKLIKEKKMDCIIIDGIQFIDINKYKELPVTNRRK